MYFPLKNIHFKIFFCKLHQKNMGMFKNNEAFHFMASYAHNCLDFKDQT